MIVVVFILCFAVQRWTVTIKPDAPLTPPGAVRTEIKGVMSWDGQE